MTTKIAKKESAGDTLETAVRFHRTVEKKLRRRALRAEKKSVCFASDIDTLRAERDVARRLAKAGYKIVVASYRPAPEGLTRKEMIEYAVREWEIAAGFYGKAANMQGWEVAGGGSAARENAVAAYKEEKRRYLGGEENMDREEAIRKAVALYKESLERLAETERLRWVEEETNERID
jgi:hypothetical protein